MKAIITDLDRTLLHTDKTISAHTLEVFGLCREKGIQLIAATARPERAVSTYQEQANFDAVITLNGARCIFSDGYIEEFHIQYESVSHILRHLGKFKGPVITLETDSGIYSNAPIPEWDPVVLDDFSKLISSAKIFKIIISSKNKDIYDKISGIMTDDTYYSIADNELIQIMDRKATKRNAVEAVLKDLGISREDSVYFGDDNDDLECIRWCGHGIAVSNAIMPIIYAADDITASNDEDGVAGYIMKLLESMA